MRNLLSICLVKSKDKQGLHHKINQKGFFADIVTPRKKSTKNYRGHIKLLTVKRLRGKIS
jgi:hypothetical protein